MGSEAATGYAHNRRGLKLPPAHLASSALRLTAP
jgi:hypothetical protein